jgi:DNA/RNA-binding domain of Phe-tRNA-synthetase-like protein
MGAHKFGERAEEPTKRRRLERLLGHRLQRHLMLVDAKNQAGAKVQVPLGCWKRNERRRLVRLAVTSRGSR